MNTNLAIIGVIFATIWAGTAVKQEAVIESNRSPASGSKGAVMSALVFQSSGRATSDTVDEGISSRDGSREKVTVVCNEDMMEVA